MSLSDEERTRIRQEERERLRARDEAHKEQYPRLLSLAIGWTVALVTLAMATGGR